jgi:WD40 repeat protein
VAYAPATHSLALCGPVNGAVQLYDVDLREPEKKDRERIKELVAQLDDDSYATREEACQQLLSFGLRAEAALRKAITETDSVEVRIRARRLRARIQREARALLRVQDGVELVAFSLSGKTLATASKDGIVRLWDVAMAKESATLRAVSQKQYKP